jgi:hypothetical protein
VNTRLGFDGAAADVSVSASGCSLRHSHRGARDLPRKERRNIHLPRLFDLARFAFFSGLLVLAAWIAGTGRVAYIFIMLVIAAALGYAVLDLVDYEIVKRKRRG